MPQKILKVGTSAAVTIPKQVLEELNLKIGDSIQIEVDKKRRTAVMHSHVKRVDQEVLEWTKKFIERYRPALEALAKK
jgi:putative addiction module antidote